MEKLINSYKVDASIRFEFKPNPKKKHGKAYARYERYQEAANIVEYLQTAEPKYAMADLRYDEAHGHLKLFNADGEHINQKETAAK